MIQRLDDPQWYKKGWTLGIKDESWVEDTVNQVDFVVGALSLAGRERILDLACGFGRHSIEFAKRGYSVVGVDITRDYIDDARETARSLSLGAEFICADIRDISYENEFDAVLNLADGAVGYLETDEENLKIFDAVARALKPGGKHYMDICNAEHAECFFPKKGWEAGTKSLALSEFDWDPGSRKMYYAGWDIPYGEPATRPKLPGTASGTRLYSSGEIREIFRRRGMEVFATYSDYYGSPETDRAIQFMVCSRKKG